VVFPVAVAQQAEAASPTEISLFVVSVAINAIAPYLFLWANGSAHSRVELATSDLLAIDAEKATAS
jgi:hypothetical protein